jgi:hypothetical protein
MESCYFCKNRPAEAARPMRVMMRKTLGQSGSQLAYKKVNVQIPSCDACRAAEEAAVRKIAAVSLGCVLVPGVVGAVWAGWQGFVLFGALGFIPAIASKVHMQGRSAAHLHPQVQELVKDRWDFV